MQWWNKSSHAVNLCYFRMPISPWSRWSSIASCTFACCLLLLLLWLEQSSFVRSEQRHRLSVDRVLVGDRNHKRIALKLLLLKEIYFYVHVYRGSYKLKKKSCKLLSVQETDLMMMMVVGWCGDDGKVLKRRRRRLVQWVSFAMTMMMVDFFNIILYICTRMWTVKIPVQISLCSAAAT